MKTDFDTEAEYKAQLFKELLEIIKDLGWTVAIPDVEEDEDVPGLVIGTKSYVSSVTDALKKAKWKNKTT